MSTTTSVPARSCIALGQSVVKAETAAEAGRLEEGQGELVVVHGETLVRSACEREPQCMTAAGFRLDAKAERKRGSGRRASCALAVGLI